MKVADEERSNRLDDELERSALITGRRGGERDKQLRETRRLGIEHVQEEARARRIE